MLDAASSRSFHERINDVSNRKSMLRDLAQQIKEQAFPHFIPESEELLALPVVIR